MWKDGIKLGDIDEIGMFLYESKKDMFENDEINIKEEEEFFSNGEEFEISLVDIENLIVIKVEIVFIEVIIISKLFLF